MNFTIWILKRIYRTVFGDEQYGWVAKYRSFIMYEKGLSIVLTLICGIVWFLGCTLLTIWLVEDKELGGNIIKGVIFSVPLFYVYNWLAALHSIYETERMAVWESLKQ